LPSTGALVTALRGDRYVVNCIDSHPTAPLLASCGIDATVKLWSPCLTHPRAFGHELMTSVGYNEVQRAAIGAANMFRGFADMCRALSRQHTEVLLQRLQTERGV
jgi:WD40 repeat protein